MSDIITVGLDRDEFKRECLILLQGSLVAPMLEHGISIDWAHFGIMSKQLLSLALAVVASVEIVKTNIIKMHDPDGTQGIKFDTRLALDTAIELLDDAILFKGLLGGAIEKFDQQILKFIVDAVLFGKEGVTWLSAAKVALGIM